MRLSIFAAGILAAVFGASLARAGDPAGPIRIYAAGSLGAVLPALIAESGLPAAAVAPPVFGPAGALGQRIMGGEPADLFASADLAQPTAVAAKSGAWVVPFARNRMCVMLSPQLRLATSTPGADPGGDYARAVFAKADAQHPGAAAALIAKSLLLLGGPGSMTPLPGHSPSATIFLGHHADMLLYYCSGTAATAAEVPGLMSIPVPDALEVGPVCGLALLTARPMPRDQGVLVAVSIAGDRSGNGSKRVLF